MATACLQGPQGGKDASQQQGEPFLPPGFRFHPTDEELVSYYLTKKVLDSSFAVHAIAEVDLNKCEPWDLPGEFDRRLCSYSTAVHLSLSFWCNFVMSLGDLL